MMVALNLPSFMDFYKSPIVFLFLAHVAIATVINTPHLNSAAFPIDPSEVNSTTQDYGIVMMI